MTLTVRKMGPCLALSLLCVCLPAVHPSPCSLRIVPENPTVALGGSVVLNCTSSCPNDTRLGWETSVQKVTEQGAGWLALIIRNLTDWNLTPMCFTNFGEQVSSAMIHVYRFSPPQIHLGAEIVAGRQSQITCNVSSQVSGSSPSDINVTLGGRGGVLNESRGSPAVGYSFVAQPTQQGEEIVCRARLRVGHQVLHDSARAILQVWAPPHSVNVSVAQPVFPPGTNITVRCSAQGNPPPKLHWELPSNASVELSDHGRTVTVSSAQHANNGTYRCLAQNRYGASSGQVDVLVRDSPKRWGLIVAIVFLVVIVLLGAGGAWLLVRKRVGTS